MSANYEVWLSARHPKTLESVASIRVFTHADRLHAEAHLERAHCDHTGIVQILRTIQPGAIVNAEMRAASCEVPPQVLELEWAMRVLDAIRAGKLARRAAYDLEGAADRRALVTP